MRPSAVWDHRNVTQRTVPRAVSESWVAPVAWWKERGVSRQQLRTLVRSGDLIQTRYGVYATKAAVAKAALTPRLGHALEVRSAMAVIGEDVVASHHSAALIHGLEMLNQPAAGVVTFTCSRNRHHGSYKGVVFHTGELPPRHVMKWRHIPVTTMARTVVDLARILPFMEGVVVADAALRTREITPFEFEPVLTACTGWPGIERAREAVGFCDLNAGSVFESCLRVFLRRWGFDPPETQVTIIAGGSAFDVDFLYREQMVVIETDGMAKYKTEKDLRKQFHRDRLLRDAGYKVVHVTWDEAFRQPGVVISRIKKALIANTPF